MLCLLWFGFPLVLSVVFFSFLFSSFLFFFSILFNMLSSAALMFLLLVAGQEGPGGRGENYVYRSTAR